jgi:hypothetical protein
VFGRRKASQSSAHGVLGEAKPRPKRIELLFFAFIGEKSEGSPPSELSPKASVCWKTYDRIARDPVISIGG